MTLPLNASSPRGALVVAPHPWADPWLASLYDVFPFDADIPFYLDLAQGSGDDVLEVACGTGRLLLPLAAAGLRVTGVDASPPMLALAKRKLAEARGLDGRARLERGSMESFSLEKTFDVAIVAAKSFVYLRTRRDQERALSGIAEHVRPGGRVALDLLHPTPDWLAAAPGSMRQDLHQELPDGGIASRVETVVSTDLAAQVRVIRSTYEITDPDGAITRRVVQWPFRYTFRHEAELLLEAAGFDVEAVYGGYEREPFTSASEVMLVVARRS